MSMEKSKVVVWEIYETTDGNKVVIVNNKPFRQLRLTETIMENILPIVKWREAGLKNPVAAVMEQWESVAADSLITKVGKLEEYDFLRIAVEYARRFACM